MDEYKIQYGDVFEVRFLNTPDLNEELVVRPDGKISLPRAEELFVAGMTPAELDRMLTDKMAATLRNPEISIVMREFAGQKVYVGGHVNSPGVFPMRGRTNTLQAILLAGGLRPTGDENDVVVLRNTATGPAAFVVDLERQMDPERTENPFWIEPYDVVFVPETTVASWGDFVDQYIRRLLPISLHAGYSWVDQIDGGSGNSVTFVN